LEIQTSQHKERKMQDKALHSQTITPFLWFDGNAEDAMKFYVSIFKDSKILGAISSGEGTVSGVSFELEGQEFILLNGGPEFKFSPAISFYVSCETQEEVDDLWEKLSAGGEKQMCGWLKDQFGVSRQIIPWMLTELLGDPDPEKSERVMNTMLQMKKLDIHGLQRAYEG
jgi:predicted 3-demethylubiquinone-9 3-methyltransferase (glyoxalase superfamily)